MGKDLAAGATLPQRRNHPPPGACKSPCPAWTGVYPRRHYG
jgi:hypothetical protein